MALRSTTGEITTIAAPTTAAASDARSFQRILRNRSIAAPINNDSKIALARNQQDAPISSPQAAAQRRLLRFTANSNVHVAPRITQLTGASGRGVTPYTASRGQSAATPPAQSAERHPKAETAMPTISRTEKASSIH